VLLFLVVIARVIGFFLESSAISPAVARMWQFLRGQSLWVLGVGGCFACALVYLLTKSIVNETYGDTNIGLAFCYGHRQMQKPYYEQGLLIFEDGQMTFKPDSNGSSVFTLPYNRIISSKSEWDDISIEHALVPFNGSDDVRPTHNISIRYKGHEDNNCVLEVRLPRDTQMMAIVRQKLFNEKVETNL
jgi:hypothetical protein